jgi:hypothetical protein
MNKSTLYFMKYQDMQVATVGDTKGRVGGKRCHPAMFCFVSLIVFKQTKLHHPHTYRVIRKMAGPSPAAHTQHLNYVEESN